MTADHHDRPAPAAPPPLTHELSDADPAPVLKFLVFLVAFACATALAVVFFYNFLERREAAEKTARYPLSLESGARPLPPPPRLQTYPFDDIKQLRQVEQPLLTTYEWIDKEAGTVRIPVERAIELLAERGLPHRAPGAAAGAEGGGGAPAGGAVGRGTTSPDRGGSAPEAAKPPAGAQSQPH